MRLWIQNRDDVTSNYQSFIRIYPLCSAHAKCGLEVSHNCKSFVGNVYMVVSDTWNCDRL